MCTVAYTFWYFGGSLPEGLHAVPFYDAAEIYRERLDLLLRNARIGLVLVLLILGLYLEARVRLAANLNRLEEVWVMLP